MIAFIMNKLRLFFNTKKAKATETNARIFNYAGPPAAPASNFSNNHV